MLTKIQEKILHQANLKTAISDQRFFKEPIKTRGIRVPAVKRLAHGYFKHIDPMDKASVFALCEDLMQTGWQEEFLIACEFSHRMRGRFVQSDFKIFEKWIHTYVDNWAKCDTFCNHTMGALIEKFPVVICEIKKWTMSESRWVRRAAAVSFIIPARAGKFLDDVFEISDLMLADKDDMVRKGYGWALKVAGMSQPKKVYDFAIARVKKMPRTAYRYAIEKLPADMRIAAMKL